MKHLLRFISGAALAIGTAIAQPVQQITNANVTGNITFGTTAGGKMTGAAGALTATTTSNGNFTFALNGTGQVVVPLGNAGAPGIAATGDLNSGIYFGGSDSIGIVAGGTALIYDTTQFYPGTDATRLLGFTGGRWKEIWHGKDSLGTTAQDGIMSINSTAAGAGAQQYSPSFEQQGRGWKTDATAASRVVGFRRTVRPVEGAANPSGILAWEANVNGSYTDVMTLTNGGALTAANGFVATSGGFTGNGPISGTTGTFTGQLIGGGTATNDAAAAGVIGELLTGQRLVASAAALTTATGLSIASITLTAGDWEVTGSVHFIPANTTVVASLVASFSATDNTQASVDSIGGWASIGAVYTSGGATMSATPAPLRVSLAATTTYYLVGTGTFSVSTCTAYGPIRARRPR